MKKLNILGYIATFFMASYAVFKFVQIPGAAWFMLFAGILLAVYMPLLFLENLKRKRDGKVHSVYKFGALLFAMIILSIVFTFNLWGFFYYSADGTEVPVFSLPPISLNIAYYLFSFVFIPWLIIVEFGRSKKDLIKNIIGGLGLSIISISLIGAQLKAYSPKPMFMIGSIILIVIYLPWHIYSLRDKSKEMHSVFLIFILAYIFITFIYGIYLKWDVSWHEVLLNAK